MMMTELFDMLTGLMAYGDFLATLAVWWESFMAFLTTLFGGAW
jgi:hypothetical protein